MLSNMSVTGSSYTSVFCASPGGTPPALIQAPQIYSVNKRNFVTALVDELNGSISIKRRQVEGGACGRAMYPVDS